MTFHKSNDFFVTARLSALNNLALAIPNSLPNVASFDFV